MKYSKLFGKTQYEARSDAAFTSHQLLTRGGFIRESVAGRYFFLPLGWRVHEKVKNIIKEEMDAADAQEMLSPTLHPMELWEETNRTDSVGFELMSVRDRRDSEFALGGTAEEMFVDVVRKFQMSYRDLPFNIYQFSNKFRDELRARGGLLRMREFVMKDAYSFHADADDFRQEYEKMAETYHRIYERMGLNSLMVEADNGYIGGEYCHEFQVESEIGEGRFFVTENGEYAAHEDVATFLKEQKNTDEELKEYKEIDAQRGNTMEDGVELHGLPLWRQLKDVMLVDENERMILAVIRGDFDVNEIKLAHLVGAHQLRPATTEEIRAIGSEPGFISPVGLEDKVTIVADTSVRTIKNAYGGANKKHRDALNINIDRDWQADIEGDIAMAQEGYIHAESKQPLIERRGIEVGNIFQLGHHYTTKMANATFTDAEGEERPFYMGCYGIGLGRTLASVVEKHHDEDGIIWPEAIAPFQVHLISLRGGEERAQEVYDALREAGIEVLWDDRDESPGVKFADADLIGNPIRLVTSSRNAENVEWKRRTEDESEVISLDEVIQKIYSL